MKFDLTNAYKLLKVIDESGGLRALNQSLINNEIERADSDLLSATAKFNEYTQILEGELSKPKPDRSAVAKALIVIRGEALDVSQALDNYTDQIDKLLHETNYFKGVDLSGEVF